MDRVSDPRILQRSSATQNIGHEIVRRPAKMSSGEEPNAGGGMTCLGNPGGRNKARGGIQLRKSGLISVPRFIRAVLYHDPFSWYIHMLR